MRDNPTAPRWAAAGTALIAAAGALTGCGGPAGSLPPAGAASLGGGEAFDRIIAEAPVAAEAAIPAGSLMARIRARGVLNVGGTDTAALFSLRDPATGRLTGFDAGLAQLLAKYIIGSPKVNLVHATVTSREALLQNGTVDVVQATYTITPGRARKVAFAGPYYSSGDAILVAGDSTGITQVADLAGRTVCTLSNSTAANDIKRFAPTATVVLFETNGECQKAVEQKRVDAYVLDQAILLGDAYRDPGVKVVGQPFTSEPYGIGVPLNSPEMKSFVNDWLRMIEADGEWARLWKATIGIAVSGEAPPPPVIGSVEGS